MYEAGKTLALNRFKGDPAAWAYEGDPAQEISSFSRISFTVFLLVIEATAILGPFSFQISAATGLAGWDYEL